MSYIILAAVAVVVATLSIFVDRRIRANKEKAIVQPIDVEVTEEEQSGTNGEPKDKKGLLTDLKSRFSTNKQEHAEHFQQWISTNIENETLKQWLLALSPDAIRALTMQLNEFCSDLNCELSWLFENRLENDPEIERMLRDMVVSYCTACWHASQGYTDFELFKVIDEVEQNPFSRKNRDMSTKLFANLVKEDLAPSIPTELFMSSEKERQSHMSQAIHQAATSNRDAFKRVLRDVLSEELDTSKQEKVAPATSTTNGNGEQEHVAKSETAQDDKKKRRVFGKKAKAETETSAPTSDTATTSDDQATAGASPVTA